MMKKIIDRIFIGRAIDSALEDGGKGSGNWGHKGRPGLKGGSGKGGSSGGGGIHYRGAKFKHVSAKQLEDIMWGVQADFAMGVENWKKFQTVSSRGDWMRKNGYTPGSAAAESAYHHYSYQGDGMMNWLLRGGGIDSAHAHNLPNYRKNLANTKAEIDTLTADIASHKIKDPISVNRGFSTTQGAVACLGLNISASDFLARMRGDKKFADGLVGYTFRDNAFMSTSISKGFGGEVKLEINCPAGTQGTFMEDVSEFKGTNEQEFLLQRGTQLAITGYRLDGGKVVLEASVISQEPQPVPDDYFKQDTEKVPDRYNVDPKKGKKGKPTPKPTPKPNPLAGAPKKWTQQDILAKFPDIGAGGAQGIIDAKNEVTKSALGLPSDSLDAVSQQLAAQFTTHAIMGNMLSKSDYANAYKYIFGGTDFGTDDMAEAFAEKCAAKAQYYTNNAESLYDKQLKGTSYGAKLEQVFAGAPKSVLVYAWNLANGFSDTEKSAYKKLKAMWANTYDPDNVIPQF